MASDPDPSPTADPPVDPPPVEAAPAKRKRGRKRKDEETGTATPNERKKRVASSSPTMERPSRERKTVERLIQMSPPKVPVSKVLIVMQGPGTKLKDIPNVFFKLSKRKTDDNLQVLHTILFGRKSNAYFLKRNLSQFSGFVWAGNEEKQRVRVKEKLDKCTKDRLLDFSELLDIHIAKTAAKKEEIAEKLLEFLESPHATRDVVLAEQKGKHKRRTKGIGQSAAGGASLERETKEHKSSADTQVKKRPRQSDKTKEQDNNEDGLDKKEDVDEDGSAEEEDVDGGGSINEDDLYNAGEADGDTEEDNDHVKSEEEDDSDEPEESMADTKGSDEKHKTAERKIKEKASPVKKSSPVKSDKNPFKPVHEKAFSDAEDVPSVGRIKRGSSKGQAVRLSKTNTKEKAAVVNKESFKSPKNIRKSSSRKKTLDDSDFGLPSSSKPKKETKKKGQSNDNPVHKEKKTVRKQTIASKVSTKEQGKGKARRKAKVSPSTEELHSVVSNILKEVDFNTATLADILKQLGDHFNTNLMDRKAEVKQIIQDVINSMTDDEDGEDDEDDTGDAEAGEGAREESNGDGE